MVSHPRTPRRKDRSIAQSKHNVHWARALKCKLLPRFLSRALFLWNGHKEPGTRWASHSSLLNSSGDFSIVWKCYESKSAVVFPCACSAFADFRFFKIPAGSVRNMYGVQEVILEDHASPLNGHKSVDMNVYRYTSKYMCTKVENLFLADFGQKRCEPSSRHD